MPGLDLDDGYTLDAATKPTTTDSVTGQVLADGLPIVNYRYRPAIPDAKARWRFKLARATSGEEENTATAELIAGQLVSWDVKLKGVAAPITVEMVRKVPEEIREQILASIVKWSPKAVGEAGGNSPPA